MAEDVQAEDGLAMPGMTLTSKQACQLDRFITAVQFTLDPDLQMSNDNVATVREWLEYWPDLRGLLGDANSLRAEIIFPWLAANRSRRGPGYLGDVGNSGGGDAGTD